MKYLCKWSSGKGKYLDWENFEEVNSDFFYVPSHHYSEQERFMIEKLTVGDRLDLSDSKNNQWHEIERIE
jgi:hypothetical protein